MKSDVLVIGGGPAGLVAAAVAGKRGKSVILIEKNSVIARKLRITGKGRCNITNSADISEFIENVRTNSSFLYSAFYSFTNIDVIHMFEGLGLKMKEERGGRIFPLSDSAHDVAQALISFAKSGGVKIIKDEVTGISAQNGAVTTVKTKTGTYECESVIIATGGKSYPLTGSTGDGYKFAQKLGHKIIPVKPSLVPLETREKWVCDLQGLSLKNISIKVIGKKTVYEDFGEMVFTHFGVSGPVILSASANIKDVDGYRLVIDLKPALTEKQLDSRIQRDFSENINRNFSNSLDKLLPKKMIPVIIQLCGIPGETKVNQISKEQRGRLVSLLKGLELNLTGTRPVEEAIITSGGVDVKEINPSTMESKLVKNLYFAGEVIDVDAYTGGFNLQIAFSTGYLAGNNA